MTTDTQTPRHRIAHLEDHDKAIVNRLQDGLPLEDFPFAVIAKELNLGEGEILERLNNLLETGVLSRFGPMYHAERMGGALTLAAMKIPEPHFDWVTEIVNSFPEVAHNYKRDHKFNMWFVVATDNPQRVDDVLAEIETKTNFRVFNMPKIEEFYVGLRLTA